MSNYNKIKILYPKINSKQIISEYNIELDDIYSDWWIGDYQYWDEYDYWDEYIDDIYIRNEKIDILLGIITNPKIGDLLPDSLRKNLDT